METTAATVETQPGFSNTSRQTQSFQLPSTHSLQVTVHARLVSLKALQTTSLKQPQHHTLDSELILTIQLRPRCKLQFTNSPMQSLWTLHRTCSNNTLQESLRAPLVEQTLIMQSWLSVTLLAQALAITGSLRTRGALHGATRVTFTSECHQVLASAASTNKLSTPTFRHQRDENSGYRPSYEY